MPISRGWPTGARYREHRLLATASATRSRAARAEIGHLRLVPLPPTALHAFESLLAPSPRSLPLGIAALRRQVRLNFPTFMDTSMLVVMERPVLWQVASLFERAFDRRNPAHKGLGVLLE